MKSKPSILLVGAGGHARACIDVVEQDSQFSIYGLVGEFREKGKTVLGYPVIGVDSDFSTLRALCSYGMIGVGQIKNAILRRELFSQLVRLDYSIPTIVSPMAYASPHAKIGIGTIVMHGAIINAGAQIGDNCIINNQSLIEHDAVVGNHCHVSTGAIVNGKVEIGEGSFIGSRCVLREGIAIGQNCVIGMGLSVRHNVLDGICLTRRS